MIMGGKIPKCSSKQSKFIQKSSEIKAISEEDLAAWVKECAATY